MNDIARAAGVSKGTLYVYFENKERLFVELISTEKREELFRVIQLDHDNHDVAAVLTRLRTRALRDPDAALLHPGDADGVLDRQPDAGDRRGVLRPTARRSAPIGSRPISRRRSQAGVLDIDDCELAGVAVHGTRADRRPAQAAVRRHRDAEPRRSACASIARSRLLHEGPTARPRAA